MMKCFVMTLICLLAVSGCKSAPSTTTSGSVTVDGKEPVNFQDAVVIWWPEMGNVKNQLLIFLFPEKLSDEERASFPDKIQDGKVGSFWADSPHAAYSVFSESSAEKKSYVLSAGWSEPPVSFEVPPDAESNWGGFTDGGFSTTSISKGEKFKVHDRGHKWEAPDRFKASGSPQEGSVVTVEADVDLASKIKVKVAVTAPLVVRTLDLSKPRKEDTSTSSSAEPASEKMYTPEPEPPFTGPRKSVTARPGEKIWAAIASPYGTSGIKLLTQVEVVAIEDRQVRVKANGKESLVPSLLTEPVKAPVGLKTGSFVLVDDAQGASPGLVLSENSGKLKVQIFDPFVDVREVDPSQVLALGKRRGFGSLVAWKSIDEFSKKPKWKPGTLLGSADGRAWVGNWMGKMEEIPADALRDRTFKKYKAGEAVWAEYTDSFKPAKILKVLPEGKGYLVSVEGDPQEKEYGPFRLSAPLE